MADDERSFLARWSQRKAQARSEVLPAEPAPAPPVVVTPLPAVEPEAPAPAPPLTLDDVAALTHASDYSRFVAPGVEPGVSNAAMKKLFSDPHFNVMDGLDIYIDDYSQPDPIPAEMLRKMVQSKFLGLFDDEERDAEAAAAAQPAIPSAAPAAAVLAPHAADNAAHDDNSDLQLQPHDAARRSGADEGAGTGQV